MNTYSESLQQTVGSTLDGLYAGQQKTESEQRSAEYNLYYSQGALISSGDHLADINDQLADAQNINEQGVQCDNMAINLLATANTLQGNTTTATSNVATVAANIKVASNSISKVAANVGSALNIAIASCYNTDIYKKTLQANDYISTTANEAEYASQLAMEASSQCSELMSADVLSNVTTSKSALEQLLSETTADVTNLSNQSVADRQTYNEDRKAEYQAEGVLADANQELIGIDDSVATANEQLNLNLLCKVFPEASVFATVSLQYKSPFDLTSSVTDVVQAQYVFYAKASSESSVTLEQIETLFGEYPPSSGSTSRFYPMDIDISTDEPYLGCINHYAGSQRALDIDGDEVSTGQEYVAFVYVELTLAYQRYIGVYDNIISSASATFTPVACLPVVSQVTVQNGSDINIDLAPTPDGMPSDLEVELHVMLLPKNKPDETGLLCDPIESELPFYFNSTIAQQVSSANYLLKLVDFKGQDQSTQVSIESDTTDNFGCPLINGIDYYVGVLCIAHDQSEQSSYSPTLYISQSSFNYSDVHEQQNIVLVEHCSTRVAHFVATPQELGISQLLKGDAFATQGDETQNKKSSDDKKVEAKKTNKDKK